MRFLFEDILTISRPYLYSYDEEYREVGTIRGVILPVKAEDVMLTNGDPSKAFRLICELDEDIKEADKITDEEGEIYIVNTIRRFKFRGLSRIVAFIYKPNN